MGSGVMGKAESKKTCLDCLYCKVSVKSTEKIRLCYCAVTDKKVKHKDKFWLEKKLCKMFWDMT